MLFLKCGFSAVIFLVSTSLLANKTPSNVYQLTEQIVLETEYIRNKLGITDSSRTPDVQLYKTPLYVFAKSLEILEKISWIQKDSGIASLPPKRIPLKKITPSDVYQQAEIILKEIAKIQDVKNIGSSGTEADYVDGKTPSNVYENLLKVSYMLDALIKKISPTDVFNSMQKANLEIKDLAQQLRVPMSNKVPKTDPRTTPSQVLLQGYLNLHNIVALEIKEGMAPFRVPSFPKGKLSPYDVYDSVNMLRVELSRLKIHLNLKNNAAFSSNDTGKKPKDVLAIMLQAKENIQTLITQ